MGLEEKMNGAVLWVPFLLIRFGLLAWRNRGAVSRAARFAPMGGWERVAYWVYQLSNVAILLFPCSREVRFEVSWPFCAGILAYLAGLALCAASVIGFALPPEDGLKVDGVYRHSRNPMYVSYFLCFAGVALLLRSPAMLGIVLAFQISAHWIIRAEERWCAEAFGAAYEEYRRRVRRYI